MNDDMIQQKLNAVGERLNRVFDKDVDFVLLLRRKNHILCTANIEHDWVCDLMQEFINKPADSKTN